DAAATLRDWQLAEGAAQASRIGIFGRCASLPRLARVVRVRASFCHENELGEASVEMNRILNSLAPGTIPRNGMDAVQRFQAAKSIILVFAGPSHRLDYPITLQR